MKFWSGRPHRRLLFRSYLFLVTGLLAVAIVLDAGFARLQSELGPSDEGWLEQTFRLIESDLAAAPVDDRAAAAERLSREIGVGVQLLEHGDIAAPIEPDHRIARLTDNSGNVSYLREAPAVSASIRLGPVPPPRPSVVLELLPPLFYLSIFVVVGLWLRPLLRDLNSITDATQRFAADYREPMSTARDTTQLTDLARNLDEMSARLSSLVQSQKELAAALSHEMRTPLARIRFALAVMGHGGSVEMRDQLDAIGADLQEIDGLIASILSYARLDHPDLRTNWQRVPLAAWLVQTVEKCRQPDREIEIARDDAFDAAWMDPRLMALALSNLIVNASRYGRTKVRVGATLDGTDCVLTVEDDGDGVPEPARESVFKPFTRLDTSRSRETGGYGLGLAIVARVAALHGGAVTVDGSDALGGARFSVRWPVVR